MKNTIELAADSVIANMPVGASFKPDNTGRPHTNEEACA